MKKMLEKEIDGIKIEIEKSRTGKTIYIGTTDGTIKHMAWFKTKDKAKIYRYMYYIHLRVGHKITEEEYFTIIKLVEK